MLLLNSALTITPPPIALLRWSDLPHPERAVRRGHLVRVRQGVYASAVAWNALPPWERYLARVHAVALLHPDAVFCLESAEALIGMPVFGDPVVVHVLVPAQATSRAVAGVRMHRSSLERSVIRVAGITVTAPGDTAVDLARHRHNAIGLAAADAALRLATPLTRDELVAINESRVSSRGRNVARWPLARATALAETPLESISRAVIEWLGFAEPELQVTFRARTGEEDRADFAWRAARLLGEADGDLKYDGRFGSPSVVLRRQSARDNRLREHVRAIAHWGWTDATAVAPLRGILNGAGLRQTGPEDPAQLTSLTRILGARAPHRTGDRA
jgi:hypothetical protein